MNYIKINNLLGWLTFSIAFIVYYLTIEPTVSFWDCGEYISTAYKLEVGHPPGAPLFQLIGGRFFSLFASDIKNVAFMINLMSAVCSAFTIFILFGQLPLAKKIVSVSDEIVKLTKAQKIRCFREWYCWCSKLSRFQILLVFCYRGGSICNVFNFYCYNILGNS